MGKGFLPRLASGRPAQVVITVVTVVTGMLAGLQAGAVAEPGDGPPPVTVLTNDAAGGDGDIFLTPFAATGEYASGPEIIDGNGRVVWFHPVPAGQLAADFRTQTYRDRSVLTFFQGRSLNGITSGSSSGTDYIYDAQYHEIGEVHAGNGFALDGHEFLITPWNTALILADTTTPADLTAIGGRADQTVINAIVQEIDIPTGKVLFQWNSADHVPYDDSEQPLPDSSSLGWDWFHINAVHLDTDGNLLIGGRHTWTVYKVNRHTGETIWRLGGKRSSFTLTTAHGQVPDSAGKLFAWQHDPEAISPGRYTVFDNESNDVTTLLSHSRVITLRLNIATKTATLETSYDQPEGRLTGSMGNAQHTRTGNLFVGWGSQPYFSEFSPSGRLMFNARFPSGVFSYRAYRFPWPTSG